MTRNVVGLRQNTGQESRCESNSPVYLDEDTIDKALIRALRKADLDVVTVADASRLGLPDEEQLVWATEQKRVIYSYNMGDFCRLHRDFMVGARIHTGIILVS